MERKDKNDLYRKKLSVFTELYRLYKHCYNKNTKEIDYETSRSPKKNHYSVV